MTYANKVSYSFPIARWLVGCAVQICMIRNNHSSLTVSQERKAAADDLQKRKARPNFPFVGSE